MKENKIGFEDSAEAKGKGCGQNKMNNLGVMSKAEIVLKKLSIFGDFKAEKLKGLFHGGEMKKGDDMNLLVFTTSNSSKFKVWALRVACVMLLWTIIAVYCKDVEDDFKLTFFFNTDHSAISHSFAPQRIYKNNGYLMVSSNGGLNQMRAGICDMVAIARYLNVTFVVPELDNTSFWHDQRVKIRGKYTDKTIMETTPFEILGSLVYDSQFQDVFDVDYFINSLRDEVQILKELPPEMKQKIETESLYSMPPISWSNMTYYYEVILPRIKTYGVVHFTKTDARLANNGIPKEVQRLRCKVNYQALRFTPPIERLAKKIVSVLKERGPFLSLHLRYEMDMIAFSGCNEGCNQQEIDELTQMRYAFPWWKEKEIDSEKKRRDGLCPLTPEETTLTLQALDIDPNIQVYIAAGDIYKSERRMKTLKQAFPNLVKKETLLQASELEPFQNHSNQMAALDYYVSIESDIFVPSFKGHMAELVEGHRRYLGFRKTIILDREVLVGLIDMYKNGTLKWEQFSSLVKATHADHAGKPTTRTVVPGKPKLEDYFYTNPQECFATT